eukprot:6128610-Prymnesium_polylepis.1
MSVPSSRAPSPVRTPKCEAIAPSATVDAVVEMALTRAPIMAATGWLKSNFTSSPVVTFPSEEGPPRD